MILKTCSDIVNKMYWPLYIGWHDLIIFLKRTNGRWGLSGIVRRHVHLFLSQTWHLYIVPNMIYPFITQVCRREPQDRDLTMVLKITQQYPNSCKNNPTIPKHGSKNNPTIPKHTQARLLKDTYYRLLFFWSKSIFFTIVNGHDIGDILEQKRLWLASTQHAHHLFF